MSFTVKLLQKKAAGQCGGTYSLLYNDSQVCKLESWGFDSCAVNTLSYFRGSYNQHMLDPIVVKEMFVYLSTLTLNSWNPQEYYYCLSDSQLYPTLRKHPQVRLIDKFTNKAHGGRVMSLYRFSVQKDFKKK